MPPEESLYPADWLRIAEKDWGRVELNNSDFYLYGPRMSQMGQ